MRIRPLLIAAALWAAAPAAFAQGEGARPLGDEEQPPPPPPPKANVLTKAPALVEDAQAVWPEAAQQAGIEADVTVILTIDATGSVGDVQLQTPPAGYGLDEAALDAARRLRFTPAEVDGVPSPIRVPFTFHFRKPPPPAPARLTGRVVDALTGEPVAGARVHAGAFEVVTDADGRYVVEGLPPGPVDVEIGTPAHLPSDRALTLAPGVAATLDVTLFPVPTADEIVVRGNRERTSLTKRTLEGEVLRTVPGSFGDPLRAIQNLPGLQRAPYVLGVLLVRGANPGDSAVFVDGHELPLAFHFLGGPSVLAPDLIDHIDFYPGNFSVRYGRAIGGIIDVTTREGRPKAWHGTADVDLFDAGGFVEGPLGADTTLQLAARRSYIDGVLRAVDAATDSGASSVLPVYYDYQARVDHRFSAANRISVLAFGSEDHLSLVGDPGGTGDDTAISARIAFHRLKFSWTSTPHPGLEWTLSPTIGVDVTTFDAGQVQLDATIVEYGARYDLRLDATPDLTLRTGLDALGHAVLLSADIPLRVPDYRPYPGSDPGDRESSPVNRTVVLTSAAPYFEAEWKPGGGPLTLIPGLRLDTYLWVGRLRFFPAPRLNARYALAKDWTLKAGAGLFDQPPQEWRLDEELGNPDLKPEWAEHYGLGVEWRATEALSVDLDGFYLRRHDLSERSDDVKVSGGSVDAKRFENSGQGYAYGLEVLVKHEVTRNFYGWIAYTLSRSMERLTPHDAYQPTRFDQTHILTALASYKLGRGWEIGARFRLVTGNPDTPIVGATFDGDRGSYVPLLGAINSTRQPVFDQLDLRVEKTWTFQAWALSAYLDVQNVYNAENPEFTAWDYRYRESAPVPGIPILPTFGLTGRF
jgi:TonB family protein